MIQRLVALTLWLAAGVAHAQGWAPTQPVRVIIPYAPVGTADIISRVVGERFRERTGQPFVIDNRPGASTQIGTDLVVKAKPDGHTLLIVANTLAVNPSLFAKLPYDALKDLAPVTYAGVTPHVLVVHPSLPARSLTELIKLVRAQPGRYAYGSVGNGTSFHLGMEQLKKLADIDLVHIPYKGMGPVLTDLMSNQVQVAFANAPNAIQLVQAGKLRAIAMAHGARLSQYPDVPTVEEAAGFTGFASNSWFIFFAPAATPAPILDRLNAELVAILREPGVQQNLTQQGVEITATTRAEATQFMRREIVKYAEIVKFSGAKVD